MYGLNKPILKLPLGETQCSSPLSVPPTQAGGVTVTWEDHDVNRKDKREGNITMRTVMIPFGLRFAEPFEASFPAREVAGAVLCKRHQIAVFDGRPLCELMTTEMVESNPTERDGKDPINVDSDPFYD